MNKGKSVFEPGDPSGQHSSKEYASPWQGNSVTSPTMNKQTNDMLFLDSCFTLGGRVKQVQPFKGFPPFDLGAEFIHGSNTVVNKIAHDNGWIVLPVSQFYLSIVNNQLMGF